MNVINEDTNKLAMIGQNDYFTWEPKPDITALELANALPVLLVEKAELVDRLPDEVRRHFTRLADYGNRRSLEDPREVNPI